MKPVQAQQQTTTTTTTSTTTALCFMKHPVYVSYCYNEARKNTVCSNSNISVKLNKSVKKHIICNGLFQALYVAS
jgi:hypothetical protein